MLTSKTKTETATLSILTSDTETVTGDTRYWKDKVETGVLLHKLKDSKVLGKFLDPSNRKQAVAVDGRLSGLSPVISGVPQGTVIGPILFLLHISCIAREVSPGTHITSYVDDTRDIRSIADINTDSDALQSDL
jgi:hypothetical protein